MAYMMYDSDEYYDSYESDVSVDSLDWTNDQDSEENHLRSDVIGRIIYGDNQTSLRDLVRIVESGWDVNELLNFYEDYHKLGQRNNRKEIDLLSYAINNSRVLLEDIVKLLLKHGANPNIAHQVEEGRYRTALHEATRQGLTDMVKILLDAGATYTISDPTESPLPLALQCRSCPLDLIKLLLEHGEDPSYHKNNEAHPLTIAIHNTRDNAFHYNAHDNAHLSDIVQLLLEHGANPNIEEKEGERWIHKWIHRTPIQEAAARGWTAGVKMLLDAGADCKVLGTPENPLALAVQNKDCHPDLIRLLLSLGVDPNDHGDQSDNIPLINAIRKDKHNRHNQIDPIIIKLLLEHGANLNVVCNVDAALGGTKSGQRMPLHLAITEGQTEVVKILLDAGAKFKTSTAIENPLSLALQDSNCPLELIELLLKHVDPNDHDGQPDNVPLLNVIKHSPLHLAVTQGLTDVVKLLLDAGAKFKTSTALENPLALALQEYNCPLELIELLLKHVDPNDHDGQPENVPLLIAIKNCRYHKNAVIFVKLLLGAGAKCKMLGTSQNPLALAPLKDNCDTDLIELLLKHGADPNDHDGQYQNIPLMCAIECGQYNEINPIIIKLLLDHGASPNVVCDVDIPLTPLHLAVTQWQTEVVKMLLDAGAEFKNLTALENPLALALENGRSDPDLIKLLLNHGADPNDHNDQFENIPLMSAIGNDKYGQYNQIDPITIKLLLKHGANPNVVCDVDIDDRGAKSVQRTPLHLAAKQGQTEVVKILLDAGAKSTALENPLALALQKNGCDPELIELLLKDGADPNHHDDQRQNIPLFQAILNGSDYRSQCLGRNNKMFLELLLQHGANPNVSYRMGKSHGKSNGGEPLYVTAVGQAAKQGWTEGLKMLLDAGAKADTSALFKAAMKGSTEGVQPLLDVVSTSSSTTSRFVNPLALALENKCCPTDLIKLLLKHGADPNDHDDQFDNIPLMNAIVQARQYTDDQYDPSKIQVLLDHGANPNVEYRSKREGSTGVTLTALQVAARQGLTDVVKMLLNAGAKIITSDPSLGLALQNGYCKADLIELLLKHGADPNQHNNDKNAPLTSAIQNVYNSTDCTKIVQLLLEHGANPNCKHRLNIYIGSDKEKWVDRTPIQEAAARGWTNVVRMLLEAGATCEITDPSENPLALALCNYDYHDPDLIEMLLTNGVDPNHHEEEENIPLTQAIHNVSNTSHCAKIVQLLLENGANPNVFEQLKLGDHYDEDDSGTLVYRTPIHEATLRGWTEGVKMLLDAGATCRTDSKLENPLKLAVALDQEVPPDLIELLLRHCTEVNYSVDQYNELPLLHKLSNYFSNGENVFLQKHLDLFFQHGGNVDMGGLEHAITERSHSNAVRWLIRHGADTAVQFTIFTDYFAQSYNLSCRDTPLILLQAGMGISGGALKQINSMEVAISTQAEQEAGYDPVLRRMIDCMWNQVEKAERGNRQRMHSKKCTFPEYLTQQRHDLEAFSDRSLHIYPEDTSISSTQDLIHQIVEFMSQPQSLQWYCRRCVRESLVSLQPSVVKSLPVPARFKRYILCHEI